MNSLALGPILAVHAAARRKLSPLPEGLRYETVHRKTLPLPRLRQGCGGALASAHFHRAIRPTVVPHASSALRRMLPPRLLVDFHASAWARGTAFCSPESCIRDGPLDYSRCFPFLMYRKFKNAFRHRVGRRVRSCDTVRRRKGRNASASLSWIITGSLYESLVRWVFSALGRPALKLL